MIWVDSRGQTELVGWWKVERGRRGALEDVILLDLVHFHGYGCHFDVF